MELTHQAHTQQLTAASILSQLQTTENSDKQTSRNELPAESPTLTPALTNLRNSLGSMADVMTKHYNPTKQFLVQRNAADAMIGKYPTLTELDLMFGSGSATAWLMAQLENLNTFVGNSRKMDGAQIEETAQTIRGAYHDYKVTEIMLFFVRFKSGRYGRFYGAVDPLLITNALNDFNSERTSFLDQYEQRMNANKPPRTGCISREEYDKLEAISVPIRVIKRDDRFLKYFHVDNISLNGKAKVLVKKTEFEAFDAWCRAGFIRILSED